MKELTQIATGDEEDKTKTYLIVGGVGVALLVGIFLLTRKRR